MEHSNLMQTAKKLSEQSHDPERKVGCVIVDPIRGIVASGVSDKLFHAEEAAMDNGPRDLSGMVLYSTGMPCHECARELIVRGIDKVYALRWDADSTSVWTFQRAMFDFKRANVPVVFMEEVTNDSHDHKEDDAARAEA